MSQTTTENRTSHTYSLFGGATLTIKVTPHTHGTGYHLSAVLATNEAERMPEGGTIINNADTGRWIRPDSFWWCTLTRQVGCKSAAIARAIATSWIQDANNRIADAIAKRASKLALCAHILPEE